MSSGSLKLFITDLTGAPAGKGLSVSFSPNPGSPGGTNMNADFGGGHDTDFVIEGILCRGGPGTLYRVRLDSADYKPYAFFQTMVAGQVNAPPETHFRMVANPKRITAITDPAFQALPPAARSCLDTAAMIAPAPEDRGLRGLQGSALYDALGPLRKACLLNIIKKAGHGTSDRCSRFFRELMVVRQDRFFCMLEDGVADFLRQSPVFKSAPGLLHDPLPGFERGESFKSRDAHANIQLSLMRHKQSGRIAADVDIDEASGIEHGFEVIRNRFAGRTNPYLIRELLLLCDPVELTLDPGYRFVFKDSGLAVMTVIR